jgi:hypothetical protein
MRRTLATLLAIVLFAPIDAARPIDVQAQAPPSMTLSSEG